MVKIHRIWFNTERMDREDHYKITLFSRPRVSIHVDDSVALVYLFMWTSTFGVSSKKTL